MNTTTTTTTTNYINAKDGEICCDRSQANLELTLTKSLVIELTNHLIIINTRQINEAENGWCFTTTNEGIFDNFSPPRNHYAAISCNHPFERKRGKDIFQSDKIDY